MKVQSGIQNSNSISISQQDSVKDEKLYQVSKKQRDEIINRLYDLNEQDNHLVDYQSIIKIQKKLQDSLTEQRSMTSKTPCDTEVTSGMKYGIDKELFGVKESIYFQIPSSLSLVGNYKCFIYFGVFFTFYFLLFGIVTFGLAMSNSQVSLRYDNYPGCENQQECTIEFEVNEYLKAPVHIYYSLGTFHQNHFQYQDSIVYEQLRGEQVDLSILKEKCDGALLNSDMFPPTQVPISVTGARISPVEIAYPCGMASKWVFNDTFQIQSFDSKNLNSSTVYEIDKKRIALKVDQEDKFKRPHDFEKIAFRDMQDESFMNWINTPTLPNWKKLYGTIFINMNAGKYQITIQNNFDSNLGTEKSIYFQTANAIGSKNIAFAFFFLIGTINLILRNKQNKIQQEFNPKDLNWS